MSDIGAHLSHCYQGEWEDSCKYGDEDCPAKPEMDKHTFTVSITSVETVKRADLLKTLKSHLDDFGDGEYWDEKRNLPTIGDVVVE